jgi:hypothetical protein
VTPHPWHRRTLAPWRPRALAGLAAAALLAGCASRPTTIPLEGGGFQVQYRATWYAAPAEYAPLRLTRAARAACPRGFERRREWTAAVEGTPTVVWEIVCLE